MKMLLYTPLLVRGTLSTLLSWLITGGISFALGTSIGILGCNQIGRSLWNPLIRLYTFIAKGIPAYVHILIAYFVLPAIFSIKIPAFMAGCGALAFCSSGYVAEVVRGGINTIPQGQWDAAVVLGYSMRKTLSRIILPQAFNNIFPALIGESEQLLKSTSLLAVIGVTELTRAGMNVISRELNPIPVYLIIAGIYLLFSACLLALTYLCEKRIYDGYR